MEKKKKHYLIYQKQTEKKKKRIWEIHILPSNDAGPKLDFLKSFFLRKTLYFYHLSSKKSKRIDIIANTSMHASACVCVYSL